jgi:CheY-like chemotaxis protein
MKNQPPSQLSILFADDEPSLQELMRMELPHLGHRVTVCPDGYTAVAALERESFDCMIVDLDMPGMNGIQVIERAATLSPTTESIVLTGKQSLESAVAALRFGVIAGVAFASRRSSSAQTADSSHSKVCAPFKL